MQAEQWNRLESPEINPQNHSQVIPDKEAKTIQWENRQHFWQSVLGKLDIHMQKNKLHP